LPDSGPGGPHCDELVELTGPPPAYAQVIVAIEKFLDEREGKQTLDVAEALEDWLQIADDALESPPCLLILGHQISSDLLAGPQWTRFVDLLRRVAVIAVRKEADVEAITERCHADIGSKL